MTKVDLGKDQRKDLAKLFKPVRYLPNLFLAGITDQKEILRAYAGPVVPGLGLGWLPKVKIKKTRAITSECLREFR